jgi:hypothetical protein
MPSSVKVNVPGAIQVKIAGISGVTGLANLGYTVDGVEVTLREFAIEVKSDRYGGEQGPAIEKQILGMEADIRMTLSEYNAEYMHFLQSRMPGAAAIVAAPGKIITPGTLGFAGGNLVRCLLLGALDTVAIAAAVAAGELVTPLNFPFCSVADVVSYNVGTRAARANLTLKAYQGLVSSDVVLYNRVTTA